MDKEKAKQCKTKGCNNIVIDGKRCEFCKRKTKEKNDKIIGRVGSILILVGGMIVEKAIESTLRK